MTDNTNEVQGKKIEFMFYGVDPLFPLEVDRIVERGFRTFQVNFLTFQF